MEPATIVAATRQESMNEKRNQAGGSAAGNWQQGQWLPGVPLRALWNDRVGDGFATRVVHVGGAGAFGRASELPRPA